MSFGLVQQTQQELINAGYTFIKRSEDGWWELRDGDHLVAYNRSIGDLIRQQAKELGVW